MAKNRSIAGGICALLPTTKSGSNLPVAATVPVSADDPVHGPVAAYDPVSAACQMLFLWANDSPVYGLCSCGRMIVLWACDSSAHTIAGFSVKVSSKG